MLHTEKKKILYGIEATFYNQITSNRIDSYKLIYQLISDYKKEDVEYSLIDPDRRTTRISLLDFITKYDSISSQFGVLYSSYTGKCSAKMRGIAYDILKNTEENNFQELFVSRYRKKFNDQLAALESQLKADIGIYILEFRDFDRKLSIRTYEDVNRSLQKAKSNSG